MLAEGNQLGVKPARGRASGKWGKGGIERAFTLSSPSFAVVKVENGGGEGEGLGQKGAKEDMKLGTTRKRKMEATANEGGRVRMRKSSRVVSEESEGKNKDEAVAQKAISVGTLGKTRAETSRLLDSALHVVQGKEMHSQVENLTEKRDVVHVEHIEYVEKNTARAQPIPCIAVRGKFSGLQSLMQSHMTEKAGPLAEDDSWSVQSDRGMDTSREVEDTEVELGKQKDQGLEAITSEGSLQERDRDGEYILSWNEFADQNFQLEEMSDYDSSSPNPSLYTSARRDSGISFGRHCVEPQLLNIVPHPALLLRGGEASTVLMSPHVYPCEQLQFGLNDQYEEREVYKTLGEELGRFRQEPRKTANQAMEGIWNNAFEDTQGQKEGQLKFGDVKAVEPEVQLDLQLGVVDPDPPEEAEYPILHFVVPSSFGGEARDEWYGESEAEDGWSSFTSNETVEIPEPGSGKTNGMVWSGEEWPEWGESDSPVWVDKDWGKWVESVRGPYGQEGF